MTNSWNPPPSLSIYYSRNGNSIETATIPNLLFECDNSYIATSTKNVMYFTKNEAHARLYCCKSNNYELKIGIEELWTKISHIKTFKKVSKSLIINESYISSLAKSGRKDLLLINGEELCIDDHHYYGILEGHIKA